jgi:hypothetical protein
MAAAQSPIPGRILKASSSRPQHILTISQQPTASLHQNRTQSSTMAVPSLYHHHKSTKLPLQFHNHHIANPNSHSIPIAVLSPVSIIHQFTAAQTAMSLKFSLHRTIDEKKREIEIGEEPVAAR